MKERKKNEPISFPEHNHTILFLGSSRFRSTDAVGR